MNKQKYTRFRVALLKTDELVLGMDDAVRKAYHFEAFPSLTVQVGRKKVKASVRFFNSNNKTYKHTLYFSRSLLNSLNIFEGMKLACAYDCENKCLRLGPVIGLYAIRRPLSDQPYGQMTAVLQELMIAGLQKGALVYAFSPGDIDFNKEIVRAYVYDFKQHSWKTYVLPLPDVVYDRIGSRSVEKRSYVQETKDRLRQLPGLHYFNQRYLGKWEVHDVLSQNSEVEKFLPKTTIFHEPKDVTTMFGQYSQIYLKPVQSSQGLGISWVRQKKENQYKGQYISWGGKEVVWQANSKEEMERVVGKIVNGRQYVVQQGLDLVRFEGRPCDVRLLMQKGTRGKWRLTTMVGRVALAGSKISNFGHGGTLVSVYNLLKHTIGSNKDLYNEQKASLIKLGISICHAIEQGLGDSFGELGLDIAVDRERKLWLIEANSKPARDVGSDSQEPPSSARLSVRRVVDYARYLTDFNDLAGDE